MLKKETGIWEGNKGGILAYFTIQPVQVNGSFHTNKPNMKFTGIYEVDKVSRK